MNPATETVDTSKTVLPHCHCVPAPLTIEQIALHLAPSFRERFDFTDDKQFDAWCELTFKAAAAFYKATDGWKAQLAFAAKEHAEVQARKAEKGEK